MRGQNESGSFYTGENTNAKRSQSRYSEDWRQADQYVVFSTAYESALAGISTAKELRNHAERVLRSLQSLAAICQKHSFREQTKPENPAIYNGRIRTEKLDDPGYHQQKVPDPMERTGGFVHGLKRKTTLT
jgi:hypothetical protein